jgi:hypothetical protein
VIVTFGVAVAAATTIGLIAREDVARLRAMEAKSKTPVPPIVRAALLTNDPLLLEPPRISLRALWRSYKPRGPRVLACGPSPLAHILLRKRPRSEAGRMITSYVVGRLFTPDELLRIYAHHIYLGRSGGHAVIGIADASRIWFRKPLHDLTTAEAATIAMMIHTRDPERLPVLRDRILARMNVPTSVPQPLRTSPAADSIPSRLR